MAASLANFVRLANENGHVLVYLEGKQQGIGLRLGQRVTFSNGILPSTIFGKTFRPPQSFRYLSSVEKNKIKKILDNQ